MPVTLENGTRDFTALWLCWLSVQVTAAAHTTPLEDTSLSGLLALLRSLPSPEAACVASPAHPEQDEALTHFWLCGWTPLSE